MFINSTTLTAMTEISTTEINNLIKKMDIDNKTIQDKLCPLDKSKIYRHKCNTTKFCEEYYPEHIMKKGRKVKASASDWNMRRYRLRTDLKKYLDSNIDYKDISAPLKAYINWCVKERAQAKNDCMESKYNPDAVKNILEQNKILAEARDKYELESIHTKKTTKDVVCQAYSVSTSEVGCQTDFCYESDKVERMCNEFGEDFKNKYTIMGCDGKLRLKYFFEMDLDMYFGHLIQA
jgi:hypothetical protein